MLKFWQVVRYEYTRHVLRRRFLFGLLSVPGMIALMVLIGFLIVRLEERNTPLGYIDRSGVLADPSLAPKTSLLGQSVALIAFQSEGEAQKALDSGRIQAYYVLPDDYLQTGNARLVYIKKPGSQAQDTFIGFVRASLLAGQPADVVLRLTDGTHLIVRSADGSREMSEDTWFNAAVPFLAGLALMIAIFTSSGYLMQALVEEKENRTIEIIVTSISPMKMMAGKILGIIGVGLTQLFAWLGMAVVAVWIGRNYFGFLRGVHIEPGLIELLVAVILPSFVLFSALMAAIGASVTEEREGQQVASLITLPVTIPFFFTFQLMNNPNGPLALALSFFPLTAPVALTMRAGFTTIPPWQITLNVIVLVLAALGALWLAGRALRLGMLRFGQRVRLNELLGRLAKGPAHE
jgi:ABC-2 type transport system permease protein